MTYFIYLLHCKNNKLYTGITTSLDRRLREHQIGINSRFTRANPPSRYAATWVVHNGGRSCAQRIEYFIKQKSRDIKNAYISNPSLLITHALNHSLIQDSCDLTVNYL